MSLRTRLVFGAAAAVAVAVILASALVYFLVRKELRDQVDKSLQSQRRRRSATSGSGLTGPSARTSTSSTRCRPTRSARLLPARRQRREHLRPRRSSTQRTTSRCSRCRRGVMAVAAGQRRRVLLRRRSSARHRTRVLAIYTVSSKQPLVLQLGSTRSRSPRAAHERRQGAVADPALALPRRARRGRDRLGGGTARRALDDPTGARPERDRRACAARPATSASGSWSREATSSSQLAHDLQRDAGRARRGGQAPAAPRPGRLPRAAHTAHEPAHEHRGARGRRHASRR